MAMIDSNEKIVEVIREKIQNPEILNIINQRLDYGKHKYGHGVNEDAANKDWTARAIEEATDGLVYLAAQMIKNPAKITPVLFHAFEHQLKAVSLMITYQKWL